MYRTQLYVYFWAVSTDVNTGIDPLWVWYFLGLILLSVCGSTVLKNKRIAPKGFNGLFLTCWPKEKLVIRRYTLSWVLRVFFFLRSKTKNIIRQLFTIVYQSRKNLSILTKNLFYFRYTFILIMLLNSPLLTSDHWFYILEQLRHRW